MKLFKFATMLHNSIFYKKIKSKSDLIGVIASSLCLVHCILTPFIFISQVCAKTCCTNNTSVYWKSIDFIFLILSGISVYYSAKNSAKKLMKVLLWIFWGLLFLILVNEQLEIFTLPLYSIYIPGFSLIFLHLFNQKYCKCEMDICCTSSAK